jgi:hypothetical protein
MCSHFSSVPFSAFYRYLFLSDHPCFLIILQSLFIVVQDRFKIAEQHLNPWMIFLGPILSPVLVTSLPLDASFFFEKSPKMFSFLKDAWNPL